MKNVISVTEKPARLCDSAPFTIDYSQPLQLQRTRQRTKDAIAFSALRPSPVVPRALAAPAASVVTTEPLPLQHSATIKTLPSILNSETTDLNEAELALLQAKQHRLRHSTIRASFGKSKLDRAVKATLVFGQEEAGTAVCISPHGVVLTCSHCVAESAEELEREKMKWLLFASGQIVHAECVAWDPKRDLALLRIIAAQPHLQVPDSSTSVPVANSSSFPFVSTAESTPCLRAPLICIGHPGSEDLEATEPGTKTDYDVLHVSTGLYRGCAPGQDLQDNSEIGALKHDAWTYWGHSGAPLVAQTTGLLIGMHSSWDEHTGMRRGVPLEAIQKFLKKHAAILDFK